MPTFSLSSLPDLTGTTAIVTGANSGIGRAAASGLVGAGARVVLAVRDLDRGRAAAAAMPGRPELRHLDLADLASIRAFTDAFEGEFDLLVNNAGVMAPPLSRTADGFELQFGTNHLGHFALTNLLLARIRPGGRVVTVSSLAHRQGSIAFDDLNWETRRYRAWAAYGQSKLANLLFTAELQRRLAATGSTIRATAAHPGYASTNLQFHSGRRSIDRFSRLANRLLAQSDRAGALPTLYAAVADIPGDSFAGPNGPGGWRGAPTLVGRSAAARDMTVAARLWEASEALTGVRATQAAIATG